MHSLLKSLTVVSLLVTSIALAEPEGEVVIRTRDGKSRQGRVLSETQKGYLFASARGTSVIEFANIVDMQKVEAAEPIAESPAAPMPIIAAAPIAVSAPELTITQPPPPPQRPAEVMAIDAPRERNVREGFHFGLGANVGVEDVGPSAHVTAHFEFNFGRPVYRISANIGALAFRGNTALRLSVDNLFQFNIGDHFALGAGVQAGLLLVLGFSAYGYAGPVFQPAIIKLGDRGQHQLSLTGLLAVGGFGGLLQVSVGYSFLF